MRVPVFTARSVGIGVAAGTLVAVALGQLVGSAWGLAVLTGLAAGALALAVAVGLRDGRFDFLGATSNQRRLGVWMLAYLVIVAPMFFVDDAIGIGLLRREDELALGFLFGFTGFAAYAFGGIMGTLNHLDGDDGADPRLHRVTPPPDERGSAS